MIDEFDGPASVAIHRELVAAIADGPRPAARGGDRRAHAAAAGRGRRRRRDGRRTCGAAPASDSVGAPQDRVHEMRATMARIVSLTDAVAELVHDGDSVALEGFTHLIPFAAGHEVLRQGRRDLELIRMTPDCSTTR